MSTKFAHIADTHIKNLKYHYEYREVFDRLYDILKEENVDYIIHCGDIAHTKTQISPEFVEMCSNFFRGLAAIAPTYIILGNHDGNLKNSSRQDALTPIVDALGLNNLHLLKSSGETQLNDDFTLNVLSVFDEEGWVEPSDHSRVNIALYHGSVAGVTTDTGFIMQHGDHDISIFDGHDYVMLGDIHKTNQILDEEGRVRYCGSTVQQNHGESNDKGFLIWDIEDKDNFTCEHHILKNPRPFVTIELTAKGRIPKKTHVEPGARIRLVANHSTPLNAVRKAVDVAQKRFKPEAITFLNRTAGDRGSIDVSGDFANKNLRDPVVQEELIREYLSDYQVEPDLLDQVVELNRAYNKIAEEDEEVQRNINWRLRSLEFDNLFNYGENNTINFEETSGIVGIFGKNFSGKSSIIDSLLWTIYNSTSKRDRKNVNIINQNEQSGRGKVEIDIGENTYTIERSAEKYIKKLKGVESEEAKTTVNFSVSDQTTEEPLNGMSRNDTDKAIRKIFGTLDDFLLTSMASQLDSLAFIAEGSTKRKEILAKFLDLEIFDKKFKLAKDLNAETKTHLKKLEDIDFDGQLQETQTLLTKNEVETEDFRDKCDSQRVQILALKKKIAGLTEKIESVPVDIINYDQEVENLQAAKSQHTRLEEKVRTTIQEIVEHREKQKKIDRFLETFDLEALEERREIIKSKKDELNKILADIALEERNQEVYTRKVRLLNEVPCGEEFSHCKFIRDAYSAKKKLTAVEGLLAEYSQQQGDTSTEIEKLDPQQVDWQFEKYAQVVDRLSTLTSEIAKKQLVVEKSKTAIVRTESEIAFHQSRIKKYEENRESIENLGRLMSQRSDVEDDLVELECDLDTCEEKVMELYKLHGGYEQQIKSLEAKRQEMEELRNQYAAQDLFMKCMHSNGISLDIIKKRLPLVNEEIAKVLANIVDFSVIMENDDKRLNILIKHPHFAPRPLEMGSGAEKTIAAMAIRLALLNVSSMPKGDIFILDEPGTALDEENMEGFVRLLDIVKTYFKTVLLISHLDSLKDCVDHQIYIEKKERHAHVNH